MMSNGASKVSFLSLGLLVVTGACSGENPDVVTEQAPRPDAIAASDAGDTGATASGYANLSDPDALYFADYDDNGSGPGDPIVGNDVQFVWGTLQDAPLDKLYVALYEGFGTFSNGGVPLEFSSFQLPLVIDIGLNPEEQDYDTCGTCISVLQDVTVEGEYARQLVAVSGTLEITSLPTQAGQMFTAVLSNVELAEIDRANGRRTVAGFETSVTRIELTTMASSP